MTGPSRKQSERQAARIPEGSIEFIVDDATRAVERCEQAGYDFGICIGSTHALGGLEPTLQTLKRW